MKGITPVIGVVLLMGMAVALTGFLYNNVIGIQEGLTEQPMDLEFAQDDLIVENCWANETATGYMIRNTNENMPINNSHITILINGSEPQYTLKPKGAIEPKETFIVNFTDSTEKDILQQQAQILDGKGSLTYTCYT